MAARVALCMIVRDETDNLEACIGPVADLFQEIIVVDTGSADCTRDVARRLGARVFDVPWTDSFSAARNASIERARADWIFWLDADDRVDAANRAELKALLAALEDENAGYEMTILCPPQADQPASRSAQTRLFRNDPRIRFDYRVHEQIALTIERTGGVLVATPVEIRHLGYANAGVVCAKAERNLRLLELDAVERPLDDIVAFFRAKTLFTTGGPEQTLASLSAFEARVEGIRRDVWRGSVAVEVAVLKAQAWVAHGRPGDALAAVREARRAGAPEPGLARLEAELLVATGNVEEAESLLRIHLRSNQLADASLERAHAHHVLAEVLLLLGRPREGAAHAMHVLKEQPAFGPAWVTLGEALVACGATRELGAVCARLARARDGAGALAVLHALAATHAGDSAKGERLIATALEQSPDDPLLLRTRAQILYASGARGEALRRAIDDVLRRAPLCMRARDLEQRVAANRRQPTEAGATVGS